jgi:methionine-rich copper-binding protein CopC
MSRALTRVILLGGLLLSGTWPQAAAGHAFPSTAEPRVGATVAASPPAVRIWFDGALEPVFSTVFVQDARGRKVDRGDARVNAADPTLLEVTLPPLAPGTYHVYWSAFARDGHRTEGDYTFTVK